MATTEAACGPTRAASRRTWFPQASLAPLIALPSSLTCINAREQSASPAVDGVVNPARSISHVPTAASNASVSASVSTPPDRGLRRRRGGNGAATQVQIGRIDGGTRLKDPSAGDLRHCLSLCPGLDTAGKNVSWLIEADV